MNQSSSSLEAGDLLTQGTPFITDTPNNRARRIVIGIEKAIPKVGGIAASITSLLWPKDPNKINIWDLIKEQVYEAIDKAILDQELFERKNELNALMRQVAQYSPNKGLRENSQVLTVALGQAVSLESKLTDSKNRIHLVPIISILSHIHLAILRERLTHGLDLYEPEANKQKSSVVEWYNDLTACYKRYKEYFTTVEKEWSDWRKSTLSVEVKDSRNGKVTDSFLKRTYDYKLEKNPKQVDMESLCRSTYHRVYRSSQAEIASYLALTFSLNRYLPDPDRFDIDLSLDELGYNGKIKNPPVYSINPKSEIIEGYDHLWIGVVDKSTVHPDPTTRDEAMYVVREKDMVVDEMIGLNLAKEEANRTVVGFQPLFKNHEEPVYEHFKFKELNIHFELPEVTEDMEEAPYICGLLFDSYGLFYNHCDVLYWDGAEFLRTNLINANLEGANEVDFLLHAGPCYQIKAILGKESSEVINFPAFKVYLEYREPPLRASGIH